MLKMRLLIVIAACCLQVSLAAPQFITFKDGQIGVNFAGYSAAAGLGGLLTGNAAHGGLSASANTPWGPKAAAGLNGRLDRSTSGLAYAGAEASPSVGASAILGGTAGESGISGAEAHANGKVYSKTKTVNSLTAGETYTSGPASSSIDYAENLPIDNAIQKVKPPKKYSLIKSETPLETNFNSEANVGASVGTHKIKTKQVIKNTYRTPAAAPVSSAENDGSFTKHRRVNVDAGGVVHSALSIPIGILQSLQQSLSGLRYQKDISVSSSNSYA